MDRVLARSMHSAALFLHEPIRTDGPSCLACVRHAPYMLEVSDAGPRGSGPQVLIFDRGIGDAYQHAHSLTPRHAEVLMLVTIGSRRTSTFCGSPRTTAPGSGISKLRCTSECHQTLRSAAPGLQSDQAQALWDIDRRTLSRQRLADSALGCELDSPVLCLEIKSDVPPKEEPRQLCGSCQG